MIEDDTYVYSYRNKWTNPVFRNLLEAGIWCWMCETASHKDGYEVRFNGDLVTINRGQLITAIRFIANGFGISEQVTRTFLENLKKAKMINTQTTHRGTIITICNYNKFQEIKKPTNKQTQGQLTNSQQTANTNNNSLINSLNSLDDLSAKAAPKTQRGCRIENWRKDVSICPDELGEWSVKEFNWPVGRVIEEWDRFVDHWKAKTGADASKKDWPATWRNWCRNSVKFERKK